LSKCWTLTIKHEIKFCFEMKIKRVSRIGKHRQENRSKNRNKLAQRKALNNDIKKRVKLYIYRRNVLFF